MNLISRIFLSICALLVAFWTGPANAQVTVFAAASLRGALEEVAAASDIEITVSYGGSGLMARQIAQGAPADIVLLAHADWMTWLEGQGALDPDTKKVFLSNQLVLIGPKGADPIATVDAETLLTRLNANRLALGQTRAVPAGIYARDWMESAGLWQVLRPYLAETENVRAALALVARGEVPLGVVYSSDAMAETGVDIVHHIDPKQHAPITYPAAIVAGRDRPEVLAFHDFLTTKTALDIFAAHGFTRAEDLK